MPTQEQHCFCRWALRAGAEGEPERALALDHLTPGPEDKLPAQAIAHSGKLAWKSGAHRQNIVWRARGKGRCQASPRLCLKGLGCQCFPEETFLRGGEESGLGTYLLALLAWRAGGSVPESQGRTLKFRASLKTCVPGAPLLPALCASPVGSQNPQGSFLLPLASCAMGKQIPRLLHWGGASPNAG